VLLTCGLAHFDIEIWPTPPLILILTQYSRPSATCFICNVIKEWRATMAENIPIRRVWGMRGLFWTLLIERLHAGLSFQTCALCGRVLNGKRSKRYCDLKDDASCFRRRRATDMQKLRDRARQEPISRNSPLRCK
jgi:hypothetical protein